MSGHKKWSDIRRKASPETLSKAERKTEAMLATMELDELRKARNLTQEELAERLGIRQGNVSAMEHRLDMHISTLRNVIEAMGGELHLTARFPDREVEINQFNRMVSA